MFEQVKAMTVFALVVDEGSFRKAAAKLTLSPSVVSHYISQLERHLGAPLFYRSTRKLSLTDYGHRFYPSCKQMVYCAEMGLSALKQGCDDLTGKLNMTLPAVLIETAFPKLLAEYANTYTNIELTVNFDDQTHNMIEQGIDLALRIGWLKDSNLKAKKVMDVHQVICATRQYLASHEPIVNPKDFEKHNWVKTELLLSSVELHKDHELEKISVKKGITIQGANGFKDIVMADFGLAMGPKFLVQKELDSRRLIEVLPEWRVTSVGMYFVWIDNAVKNPLVSHFTDFMLPRLQATLAA